MRNLVEKGKRHIGERPLTQEKSAFWGEAGNRTLGVFEGKEEKDQTGARELSGIFPV